MSEDGTWSPPPVSPKRLWYGTTAAMGAWIVHGLVSFVLSDAACGNGKPLWPDFTPRGIAAVLLVLGAAALIVAISGVVVSWRTWRGLSRAPGVSAAEGRGRGEFMALTGIFISTIFSIAILWGALAPMLVGPCAVTR